MPLHDIDAILDRIDLEGLADELCGPRRGHGSGARWPSPVPDHPQTGRTPPMSIFTDRRGRQRWTCWSTGTSGTAIDLVSINRQMDVSAAIQWLADRAGRIPEQPRPKPRPSAPNRTGASAALRHYVHACRAELYKPSGEIARQWLANRRLDPAVIELNDVGYDPGPSKLRRARGLPYRGPGIVLPTFDRLGQLVYAQVRYFDLEAAGRKYDNPSSKHATKPTVSWPRLLDLNGNQTIVCEGVIDALTVAGIPMQAVAVLSASDSTQAAGQLSKISNRLVLALDPDNAGQDASDRLRHGLAAAGHQDVRIARLPAGDLNEIARQNGNRFPAMLRAACRLPSKSNGATVSR
jgi:DNA primase